jgi:hypothetical protein
MFYDESKFEKESMMSELELMVVSDMRKNGYDPFDYVDVQDYWKERLA